MSKPYNVILLDTRMPDMDALELVKRMRQEQLPTTALLPMLYSSDIPQQVARFEQNQRDAYLVKPTTRRGLFRAIGSKLANDNGANPRHHLDKLVGDPARPLPRSKMRILVAEDSIDNRFLIEAYLRAEPCTLTFVQGRRRFDFFGPPVR